MTSFINSKRYASIISVTAVVLVVSLIALAGCDQSLTPENTDKESATLSTANPQVQAVMNAQNQHEDDLLNRPGIVGVGTGLTKGGQPRMVVYAVSSKKAREANLPSHLDGVPVAAKVTGMFVAGSDPTTRQRPAPVGFSVGHPDITAGTIGARVKDGSGNVYVLSNNHVLADVNEANIGDSALQPGPTDGGTDPEDKIGELSDYEPIDFSGTNTMDAAIATTTTDNVDFATPSDAYGAPGTNPTSATLDMPVQKFGRTTEHTTGTVAEIDITVDVCYETAGPFNCKSSARFENQIGITPGSFSDGGDSGSLIVTDDSNKQPVGLLFAGSDTRTLANPIGAVLNRFNVSIDDGSDGGTSNSAPTASFTVSCTDLTCDFDASGSSDSDGSIASYDWNFGDGNTGTGQTTTHTYGSDGTYTVTLTVTDDDGATDSSSQDVSVSSSTAGGIHVGDLDGSSSSQGRTWTATVTVTVHDDSHNAEDGSTVSFNYNGRDVSGSDACTTDTNGTCSVSVSNIRKRTGSVTFDVTDVSDADGSYDASSNHDPDGDSDGTTITVNK